MKRLKRFGMHISINLLIWGAFGVVVITGYMVNSGQTKGPLPHDVVEKYVDAWAFLGMLLAGCIVYALFWNERRKAQADSNEREKSRLGGIVRHVLNEMSGTATNFGSLLLLCAFVTAEYWYVIAALFSYGGGWWFYERAS